MSDSAGSDDEPMAIACAATVGKGRPSVGSKDLQCTVCDRFYDIGRIVNIGDKNYTVYRDKRCHKAVRHLERAAETKGESAKTALSNLKKFNKSDFKRLAAAARMNYDDDLASAWDSISSSQAPTEAGHGELRLETAAASNVKCETKVAMFTKRQFKAYLVYHELYSKDEAEAMWRMATSREDLVRETSEDGTMTVAVRWPKVWVNDSGMARSRQVIDIAEITQTAERAKKLFSTPDCAKELSGEMGAVLFNQGRHFVEPDLDEKEKSKAGESDLGGKRLSGSSLVASAYSTPPTKRMRTWDGMTIQNSEKGTGDEAESGDDLGIVNLVLARSTIINIVRQSLSNYVDKKSSAYCSVKELVRVKLGVDHSEVQTLSLPKKLEEFEALAGKLKNGLERAKNWTQGSVKNEVEALSSAVERVEVLAGEFGSAVVALKKVRKVEMCEKGQDSRKLGAHLRIIMGQGGAGAPRPPQAHVLLVRLVGLKPVHGDEGGAAGGGNHEVEARPERLLGHLR